MCVFKKPLCFFVRGMDAVSFKGNQIVLRSFKTNMNQMKGIKESSMRHRIIFQLYFHIDQQICIINLS